LNILGFCEIMILIEMANILIVDDDKMICDSLIRIFADMGHGVSYSLTLKEGLKEAASKDFDLVFLDVRLPDGDGIKHLPAFQSAPGLPEVIIITGFADPDSAELAIKSNAWDYIRKPASIDSVTLALTRALHYRKEKKAACSALTLNSLKREGIIGSSPEIMTCLDLLARAAATHANILISGETGTGKELFARAVHANSMRSDKNFVAVDCASLPKTLTESLLFGHIKGSFTGADKNEEGLILSADRGTLFLDEIGDLPPSVQKTFLRVLQERRFRHVGAVREISSDFRLISATNRNLDNIAESGDFRSDLLFRIRSVTIHLPPLRERTEDIKELAVNYMATLCESQNNPIKAFSPDFFDALASYPWPGNIRELYNALDCAMINAIRETTLFPKHLPPRIRIQNARSAILPQNCLSKADKIKIAKPALQYEDVSKADFIPALQYEEPSIIPSEKLPSWKMFRKNLIAEGEQRYLQDLISETKGNIKKASEISGLSQPRLYELLRKYKIAIK